MAVGINNVIREEASRSVALLALCLLGWSFIYTSMDSPPFSAGFVFVLVLLTTVYLAGLMVVIRFVTGQIAGTDTQVDNFGLGSAVGLFVFLFLILVRGRSSLLIGVYLIAQAVGIGILYLSLSRDVSEDAQ